MTEAFAEAKKTQSFLRVALWGPAGSGKTLTALKFASALGPKTALIDTERGSSQLYADLFPFSVLCLEEFSPQKYIGAIQQAKGYDTLIVDSLSQAWSGKGGVLELVDKLSAQNSKAGSSQAWAKVMPLHYRLIDSILTFPGHVIVTMRSKTSWEVIEEQGKKKVAKIGLGPLQKEDVCFEFDVTGAMEAVGDGVVLRVDKTRCSELHGKVFHNPNREVADILSGWLAYPSA
jgi:hypothetical protein